MAGEETTSLGSAMQWLEDELRQTKAQFVKLQQQVEQFQGHLWRAAEEAQRNQEALNALHIQVGGLSGLQDDARQMANEVALLREQQTGFRATLDEAQHRRQATAEKDRQEWAQLLRRLEAAEKMAIAAEQRSVSLEEGQRLLRNDLIPLQQGLGQLESGLEEIKVRAARNVEASKRLEQGQDRIDGDLDALHKQDDVMMERLQLYAEHVRRLDERLSALVVDQTTHDDIINRVELARAGWQHLGERLAALEKLMDGHQETADGQTRALDLLGARLQGQADRLVELQRHLGAYRQDLLAHLHRWNQLQQKLSRRQLSQLEQELRELKQYDLKLSAE
ncbi:MAG: hypothetical protein ACE5IZ_03730 [Dehalococcoidia bacterium]